MISIKVRNPLWGTELGATEFNYYTGNVVRSPSWVTDNQFCLSTGDPRFPYRVIDKDRLVSGRRIK